MSKMHLQRSKNNNTASPATNRNGGNKMSPAGLSQATPPVPRDTFWPEPRPVNRFGNVTGWYTPPFALLSKEEVEALARLLESEGHVGQAAVMRLYHDRALCAQSELDELVDQRARELDIDNIRAESTNEELDDRIKAAEKQLEVARADLEDARRATACALAQAGLPSDPVHLDFELAPSADALAGQAGIAYDGAPMERPSVFDQIAPWIIGLVPGLCLASLAHFVEAYELNRVAERWPKLLAVGLLGGVLIQLIGSAAGWVTRIVARHVLERDANHPPQQIKRSCELAVVLTSLFAVLLILIAEIVLEGIGIFELDSQRLIAAARLNGEAVAFGTLKALPICLVLLIGSVITLPYVAAKVARTWDACEAIHRVNWIRHQQNEATKEKLSDPKVRSAMQTVAEALRCQALVQRLEAEISSLNSRRASRQDQFDPESRRRIEAARVAASGEAAQLIAHIEGIVQAVDPLCASPRHYRFVMWPRNLCQRWLAQAGTLITNRPAFLAGLLILLLILLWLGTRFLTPEG